MEKHGGGANPRSHSVMGVTDEGRYIISRSSALNNSAQPELESQTRPGAEGNHAGMGEAGRVRYGPKLPSLVTHWSPSSKQSGGSPVCANTGGNSINTKMESAGKPGSQTVLLATASLIQPSSARKTSLQARPAAKASEMMKEQLGQCFADAVLLGEQVRDGCSWMSVSKAQGQR